MHVVGEPAGPEILVCRSCLENDYLAAQIETVPLETPPDAVAAWEWRCSLCGLSYGFSVDYGTLDLGLVRDEQLDTRDDFWVYEGE